MLRWWTKVEGLLIINSRLFLYFRAILLVVWAEGSRLASGSHASLIAFYDDVSNSVDRERAVHIASLTLAGPSLFELPDLFPKRKQVCF